MPSVIFLPPWIPSQILHHDVAEGWLTIHGSQSTREEFHEQATAKRSARLEEFVLIAGKFGRNCR
jgi:hypothetical protein